MLGLMVQIARSHDLDTDTLMKEHGINPALVKDPNARFRMDNVNAFYAHVAKLINNPNFGLDAAQYWHPSQLGALGYAWLSSDTLRAAFKRYVRFAKAITDAIRPELIDQGEQVSLKLNFMRQDLLEKFRIDGAMAVLMVMVRANAGADFNPRSISFTFDEPEDTGAYYALFQCPLNFNASANLFTISATDADMQRMGANAQLSQLHDKFMLEYIARLDEDNLIERVKLAIIDELASGNISDAIVAERLHLTERTLQRRLHEQGTTFKKLLTEVRIELADNYIRDSKLSLNEISFLLGFSELSSFSRAFKHWTGSSPRHYRQRSQKNSLR